MSIPIKLSLIAACLIGALASASAQDLVLTVKGMVCAFCTQGIRKKLAAEESVTQVGIHLESHQVTLSLKEGHELSDERIRTILKEAGYPVDRIERH